MSDFYPFDINKIAQGPARVMYAPTTVAVPTKLSNLFLQKAPYTAATGWLDAGATTGPTVIGRSFATGGLNIQQTTSTILDEITDVSRTVTIPIGQLDSSLLAIMEQSGGVTTVASGTGVDLGQTKVPFGSIIDLGTYRVAVVWRFKKSQGIVVEPTTLLERGRIAAWVGYTAKLTADNVQVSIGENEIVGGSLAFKLEDESTVTAEGTEQGFWIYETAAGTL